MQQLPWTRSCFVCGELNPVGLNLRFEHRLDATGTPVVEAVFAFTPLHVGFVNVVHGGLITTVLDEAMFWAAAVTARRLVVCAELQVRFLEPVRPGTTLRIRARNVKTYKARMYETASELHDLNEKRVAVATGKYVPVPEDRTESVTADLVGRLPWET